MGQLASFGPTEHPSRPGDRPRRRCDTRPRHQPGPGLLTQGVPGVPLDPFAPSPGSLKRAENPAGTPDFGLRDLWLSASYHPRPGRALNVPGVRPCSAVEQSERDAKLAQGLGAWASVSLLQLYFHRDAWANLTPISLMIKALSDQPGAGRDGLLFLSLVVSLAQPCL